MNDAFDSMRFGHVSSTRPNVFFVCNSLAPSFALHALKFRLDEEMKVYELQELVTGLFPDCVYQGLIVQAETGNGGRISGIWDRHDCSELP